MVKQIKSERRGSGWGWFLALGLVLFCLYSLAVATATVDDCGGGPKEWQLFPPGWECTGRAGLG